MATSKDIYSRTPTYHSTEAAYILPNDAPEHARLTNQHDALVALLKNRIVHAPVPVSSPGTVLDIGCGTGIITRYLSSHFPNAQHVYGIDLAPVPAQPGDDARSNMSFKQGNVFKLAGVDPRLQSGSADYVYSRLLLCGMTDWPGYMRAVLKTLKPGCWAESHEMVEDVFYEDNRFIPHDVWEWQRSLRAGGVRLGLDLDAGLNVRRYMEDAGFVDVQRWEYRVPYWRGAQRVHPEARLMAEFAIGDKSGVHWHMLPKLLAGMDYTEEDVQRLRMEMRRDLADEEGKYRLFYVTIGRKPDV